MVTSVFAFGYGETSARLDNSPALFYTQFSSLVTRLPEYKLSDGGYFMTIIRWDPMSTMLRWPSIWDNDEFGSVPNSSDNLDVYESKNEVVVKANVAGVDPDKVEITFEKGVLTLSATEEVEEGDEKKYYKKATRSYSYRVAVPGNIDLSIEPEATVKHGIVSVTFKKAEEAKPKKIAIKK